MTCTFCNEGKGTLFVTFETMAAYAERFGEIKTVPKKENEKDRIGLIKIRCPACYVGDNIREMLGYNVREAWIEWCNVVKDERFIKPHWIMPYENLNEMDKEADRMIGERIYQLIMDWFVDTISEVYPDINSAVMDGKIKTPHQLVGWLVGAAINTQFESINNERLRLLQKRNKHGESFTEAEAESLHRIQIIHSAITTFKWPSFMALGLYPDMVKIKARLFANPNLGKKGTT